MPSETDRKPADVICIKCKKMTWTHFSTKGRLVTYICDCGAKCTVPLPDHDILEI